jgi:phosphate transport system permease protein
MNGRSAAAGNDPGVIDPTAPLVASGNLRRRVLISRLVDVSAGGAALIAVAMLGIVVYAVFRRGLSALSLDFVIKNPSGLASGGIANALIGTCLLVAFAAMIAVPLGVLTGLYLTEFAGPHSRSGRALKLVLDLLQGLPTVIVGLFIYGLLVVPAHEETGFAGSVALSIVMLPLIARSSQEVLLLVPGTMREAADALGVSRWRAVPA